MPKVALDYAGDSHPAQEPQAAADRQHVNDSFYQDSDRDRPDPVQVEYNFFFSNGRLDVSADHDHEKLRERNNVPSTHAGAMAVGNVTVEDGVAIWRVISNMSAGAVSKVLQKYTREAGWEWGGMTDKGGSPIGNDEKLARKIHIRDHESGEVHKVWLIRDTARVAKASPALVEFAQDHNLKLAEYPGGSNMNDQLKTHSPMGEDLELKNIGLPEAPLEPGKDEDRMPNGLYKCPDCGKLYHRWHEYALHRQGELGQSQEVQEGHFPEINDANYHEWNGGEPGIHTGAKAPKDMFKEPVPFIYDIDEDSIYVGHPGARHAEIDMPAKFSPGGIVEGEYQPGGKVLLKSTSDTPYSVRHMVGLWYWQHPEFEVTGVELSLPDGNTRKLASDQTVGGYVISQAAGDPAVHEAWQALQKAGGRVYAVGGVVRDALMGKPAKDVDLMVTGLPPEQVNQILKTLPGKVDLTGKDFGVYRYNTQGYEVEIALPRVERSTGDRRVDFDVSVDHNLPVETDLERRDFTANAIAIDLADGRVVDPFGGAADIKGKILKTVHPNSFREDPTRLVRGLVAHARHGLEPDHETRRQMQDHAPSLANEAAERIQAELDKLMKTDNPAKAVLLAHETGLLRHLLPEVDECFDFDQKNPHHNYDLGTHLLNVLTHTANKTQDPDVRLAALLHDIGKPASQWINPETGYAHYYKGPEGQGDDHSEVGARLAQGRMKALKYPNVRINRVQHLIQHHMYPDFASMKGARKFINRVGDEHTEDLMLLREADRAGKGSDQNAKTPVDDQRDLVKQIRETGQPTGQGNLAINGNDLLGIGVQQGPAMGQILKSLTEVVLDDPKMNDKATLLNYVRRELASAGA